MLFTVLLLATPVVVLTIATVISALTVRNQGRATRELVLLFGYYGTAFAVYLLPLSGMIFSEWLPMEWSLAAIIYGFILTVVFTTLSIFITFFVHLKNPATRTAWFIVCWSVSAVAALTLAVMSFL